ncbi:threonyl-tRNA synthetase editing domain-containing protein [Geoalkalibacter halelectricus]|uniref:Threonyl-tRNA synthetase editing domain-containing protein n=1 Tax=Geoalkalibacter halelectricus TaxID=2847045 RepID=A0ABY5ZH49_9BACT|nr:threonyl-tRNA synthetase editing domain-containing protein [Geoalkalibacter halelectricus]MDO3376554.1 threonyl-tRNA synthetase editing domain-containing protein [Geoalkalibacter halelectricus]UWZ78482.1 threonyl-tRNA synthetase editing domain-containing protein [Geoalkalibacter halelectricus]
MKLLMIYTEHFAYQPAVKTLENEPDCTQGDRIDAALIGFIHAEACDEEDLGRVETRLIKNLKWGARKNDTRCIVLHSFSHLAETKASADFTRELLNRAEQRLRSAGYEVRQTPFGYFLDLDLKAPGRSSARIFASF